mgnify:CR=1 FL=1
MPHARLIESGSTINLTKTEACLLQRIAESPHPVARSELSYRDRKALKALIQYGFVENALLPEKAHNPIQKLSEGETAQNPSQNESKGKLPPRTPRILCSQSIVFCFLRLLLGVLCGILLSQFFSLLKIH